MRHYVVYYNPRDFPKKYVVRRFDTGSGEVVPRKKVYLGESYDEAVAAIKKVFPDACRLDRDPSDDPVIVETWI